MPKKIVFSGHGSWELGGDEFVQLPGNAQMKFYTLNAKTLSDALGGLIDTGNVVGINPDQEAGPHQSVPDLRLFPPVNPPLNLQQPPATSWSVAMLPGPVPVDDKNIQVRIRNDHGDGMSLKQLFQELNPAITTADSVLFLWAACRAVNLADAGGEALGVNAMQR